MQNCELDVVTRESVNTDGLHNIRVHHGLSPNAPALLALFQRADIFIFPTQADTLPLVIMEAMASGLPVVTTSVGALCEEVEDGVTGFLIPVEDARSLAAATMRLVTDADLRQRMGAAARRAATKVFNGSQNYRRLLEICKSCVDRRENGG